MKTHIILISLFLGIVGQINAQNFWTELNTPNNSNIRIVDANSLGWIFIGTNNGLFYSDNLGENNYYIGFPHVILALKIDNDDNIYAGQSTIYYSDSNGSSWINYPPPVDVNVYFVGEHYLLIGFWGGIFKTNDLEDWEQTLDVDNDQVVNSICSDHNNVLYAGITSFMTDAGGVYRSFDYGETWEYAGLSGYYIKTLACDSNGNLYAGSAGNYGIGIYRSQDQGLTWTGLKNDVFVESIVITPDDHIYIGCSNEYGTQGGVFASTDYGDTWEMINTGLNNENVYGLSYAPNGYLYAYGNHLHRSQNPVCSKIETQTNRNQEFMVFPNPVTDYLQIKSQTNPRSTGPVTVKMLDMYGRLVCSENNYISNSRVDVSGLDDGVYLLLIEAENKRFEQRIVKIK